MERLSKEYILGKNCKFQQFSKYNAEKSMQEYADQEKRIEAIDVLCRWFKYTHEEAEGIYNLYLQHKNKTNEQQQTRLPMD